MARFAPVVPVHIAEQLQNSKDHLGPYHLILAHDVLDKPDAYRRVYGRVRQDYGAHSFIIMDNSIVELGSPMKMDDLVEACKIVKPDCLVVPDAMGQGEETRELARKFAREYVQYFAGSSNPDDACPLMGVLQGDDVGDCMMTCATFYSLPFIDYISVPRIVTKMQGSRMPLLHTLTFRNTYDLFRGVHLLGFSDNILDDVACARMPFVQGIDSAVPIRAGLRGMDIADALTTFSWSDKLGPRGTFWEEPIGPNWKVTEGKVRNNIRTYREWIDGKY